MEAYFAGMDTTEKYRVDGVMKSERSEFLALALVYMTLSEDIEQRDSQPFFAPLYRDRSAPDRLCWYTAVSH